ncbi:MAG: hypothetical protein OXC26_22370 [Albidovulum sp.]|nr:hypothetical protein [Albidovulum sp.]
MQQKAKKGDALIAAPDREFFREKEFREISTHNETTVVRFRSIVDLEARAIASR